MPIRGFYGSGVDQLYAVDLLNPAGAMETSWALADREGNIRDVARLDASDGFAPQIVRQYDYGAFGQRQDAAAGPGAGALGTVDAALFDAILSRYKGRAYDADAAAYNFRARWLKPEFQRWLSEDPAGDIDGPNRYAAFRNSPHNYADVTGRSVLGYGLLVAGMSALDTAAEAAFTYTAAWWTGDDSDWNQFNLAATYGKHFAVNFITAGWGSKVKWGGKALQFVGRQLLGTAGDTAVDTLVYGKDFQTSLMANTAANLGGELLGQGLRVGGRYVAKNSDRLLAATSQFIVDQRGTLDLDVLAGRIPGRGVLESVGQYGERFMRAMYEARGGRVLNAKIGQSDMGFDAGVIFGKGLNTANPTGLRIVIPEVKNFGPRTKMTAGKFTALGGKGTPESADIFQRNLYELTQAIGRPNNGLSDRSKELLLQMIDRKQFTVEIVGRSGGSAPTRQLMDDLAYYMGIASGRVVQSDILIPHF